MPRIRTSLETAGIVRPAGAHRARTSRSWNGRGPTAVLTALALVAGLLGLISPVASAAVKSVSPTVDANNKYPIWYQDANGLRLAPCLDGSDAQCVLPAAGDEPQFNPALPTHFPDNFPSEFFYYLADSDRLATPGCRSSKAGTASIRMAVEGAFASADGLPAANQQVVFGRVRVRVTSGLCPNAPYTFTYPYGQITITANSSGAIPSTLGTTDIGCLAAPCNFSEALASPIFDGFLRWDPAVAPAAPAGYIGDFPTLHPVTGATFTRPGETTPANYFRIDGERVTGLQTNQWNLSGRIAGPLVSQPTTLDLGGQEVGSTGAPRSVTLTNVGADPLTISGLTLAGADPGSFAISSGDCTTRILGQDGSCTVGVTFSPSAQAVQTAVLQVAHDRLGSPFAVGLTGTGIAAGQGAEATPDPTSLTFGAQRIGVVGASQRVTVTNTGQAPLEVSAVDLTGADPADFLLFNETCTNAVVQAGSTCVVDVALLPHALGARTASLDIHSNASPSLVSVPLAGTGIGGVAAVSSGVQPTSGFPDWYQDENGVRVMPCTDGTDPNCVLPAAGEEPNWNPALPPDMTTDPVNFPSEFFYQIAESDLLTTPGCGDVAPGRASIRMALEGAFLGADPVPGEQIVFGRIRVFASGLCPNTEYEFINPYGVERYTSNAAGTVTRVAGTEDIGCLAFVPPATCNFADALQSRVLAGFLRWDPNAAPAAPAGYLGDAITLHRVVGGSYIPPGETAAVDYFRIVPVADPETPIVETNLWTVSGKLAGPLVADQGDVTFPATEVGQTSAAQTVTITNAGASPVTVGTATVTGDFAIATDLCAGQVLVATTPSCTLDVTFTPTVTGQRNGQLSIAHDGLNTPLVVGLHGLGQAVGTPAISLTPTQLTFGSQHTGTSSVPQTVTISNNGGAADLNITSVTSDSADFTVTGNTCDAATLQPNVGDCTVDVAFTPTAAGALAGNLLIDDDAPGNPHSVPMTGTGFAGDPAVSATVDQNHGFPVWYQDANGTRVEPCIEGSDPRCVLPGAPFNPGQPTVFPTNFPDEFFYWLADSNPVSVDGGTISIRTALEGTTGGVAGDQTVFGRIRIKAVGAAPNTTYTFVHPFGTDTLTTDGLGDGVLTEDIGCLALVPPATCDFADALQSRVLGGFLRWDPRFGAAPAGYLGDALTPHRVVGAPFSVVGEGPANFFRVMDAGSTVLGETNLFTVAGRMAAALRATPTALDFGDQVVTTSATQTVDVTSQSTTAVTISASVNGDYAIGAGNTCTGTLAPDATCSVPVIFTPTADGARTGVLTITPGSGTPVTVQLTGNGTGPLTVDPTSLSFGDVERDHDSAPQTVTYTNLGAADVSVTAVNFTGDFRQTGGTCSTTTTLAQGGACTVEVTFRPIAPDLPKTGSLSLVHSGANSPLSVDLAGVGTAPPHAVAEVTPTSIAFGEQRVNTASSAQTVTVRNVGDVNLIVSGVGVSGANASDFLRTNHCTAAVQPLGQCTIDVVFQPAATGARSATLTITSNASPSTNTVDLTGTGVQPVSTVSPASIAFASQRVGTTSASQTVTVTNSGTGHMTVSGVSLTGLNTTSFAFTNNCSAALAAGQSCTIGVSFKPTVTGSLSANLRIVTDTAQSPQTVALTGTGVASAVKLSSTSLSFGNVQVGRNSSRTLTIQNTGTATLNFTSFTISGGTAPGDFTITSNTCAGVSIAVGGKCSIAIRFAPTATGSRTANLVLVDDAPNSPQTVPLTGNGR